MILNRIELENFRQYRGKQSVDFAVGEPGVGKNVTVVFGENGRGKTGLYRGLMFGLFGQHLLAQDEGADPKELYLVNTQALEAASSAKVPVIARVLVDFTHRGRRFELERTMSGLLVDGQRREQLDSAVLRVRDDAGNTSTIEDPRTIEREVAAVLDPRVREYFLFDGEKIEHLTKASPEQRREVSRGIRCLLDIDDLEKAARSMHRLHRFLSDELGSVSDGEYPKVLNRLNETRDTLEAKRGRVEAIATEVAHGEAEKRRYDEELSKDTGVRLLADERRHLEEHKRSLESDMESQLQLTRDRVGVSSVLLAEGLVNEVFECVDDKRARGEIPSALRKDLIELILDEQKCICQREVIPGTPAFDAIVAWKNVSVPEALENSAMDLWRLLSGLRSRTDDLRVFLEATIQTYADTKNRWTLASERIEDITEQIGNDERADGARLESLRQGVESRITDLKAEKQRLDEDIQRLLADEIRLVAERDELAKQQTEKTELQERISIVSGAYEALESVKTEFIDEVRLQLTEKTSETFQQLLDPEGRRMLRKVSVEEDYSLQVLDPWDKPYLANISAGQRQIVSVAFILALARATAAGGTLEMPLFMDTPFGKLSWQHRENLLRVIPASSAQWILLATDTEMGRRETEALLQSGTWGRLHVLRSQEDGSTVIEEHPVEEALALIRGGGGER